MYLSTASTRKYTYILKIGIEFHKLWLSLARNVDLILLLKKHWKINYWKLWHPYQKTHNYDYDIAHYFTFKFKINKYIIIFSFLCFLWKSYHYSSNRIFFEFCLLCFELYSKIYYSNCLDWHPKAIAHLLHNKFHSQINESCPKRSIK